MFYNWPHKSNLVNLENSTKDVINSCKIRKMFLGLVTLTYFSIAGISFLDLAEKLPDKFIYKSSIEKTIQKAVPLEKDKKKILELVLGCAFGLAGLNSGAKAYCYNIVQKDYEKSDPRYF
jgi:hypothetical protein